jgi:hypothetical protein
VKQTVRKILRLSEKQFRRSFCPLAPFFQLVSRQPLDTRALQPQLPSVFKLFSIMKHKSSSGNAGQKLRAPPLTKAKTIVKKKESKQTSKSSKPTEKVQ